MQRFFSEYFDKTLGINLNKRYICMHIFNASNTWVIIHVTRKKTECWINIYKCICTNYDNSLTNFKTYIKVFRTLFLWWINYGFLKFKNNNLDHNIKIVIDIPLYSFFFKFCESGVKTHLNWLIVMFQQSHTIERRNGMHSLFPSKFAC